MKVFHTCSGIDISSGGPSYTITSLCDYLLQQGLSVQLHALASEGETAKIGCDSYFYPTVGPKKFGLSPKMRSQLIDLVSSNDILHSHGIWMAPNIYPFDIKRKKACKLVISPRGMLSEWSLNRSKLKKGIVSVLGQKKALLAADCLHATASSEYEDIRYYGLTQPVTIIPNGVDIPVLPTTTENDGCKRLLFFSRIHPKKGVERLVKLWAKIVDHFPEWELVICGPGEEVYLNKIKALIDKNKDQRVRYHAPVYGEQKKELYFSADIFILPTFSENFGVVVAEALAHSIPAIVTTGAPWSGLLDNRCGWWVDNTDEAILLALEEAMSMDKASLATLGKNGREWVSNEYSWDSISEKMLQTYRWVSGNGAKPNCVKVG